MEPADSEATQPPERGHHTSSSNVANLTAIKRAPSDSTVNDSLYGKSAWERSQSEANLDSIDGAVARAANRAAKAYKTKVSEHSQVYWDLPRAVEQGNPGQQQGEEEAQQQQQTPSSPGNRVVLETIHQREELKHFSSSSESLTRFYGGHERNTNHAEDNAGNYFCDSDFDDSREQRPNYLLRLERMQAELLKQMNIYKELARQRESASDHVFEESCKGNRRLASGEALDDDMEDTSVGMEDVGKLLESATVESQSQALDACHQLLVSAWETPQSGRDCATSMCSLIRREGLLTMLTANLASEATPPSLRLASARLISQVRVVEAPAERLSLSTSHLPSLHSAASTPIIPGPE